MNRHLLLSLTFVLVFSQACKQDKTSDYPTPLEDRKQNSSGNVRAKINGKEWLSTLTTAYKYKDGRFGIAAYYHDKNMITEQISIVNVPYFLHSSNIKYSTPNVKGYEDSTYASFFINDDDANMADYSVVADNNVNNYIIIESYDAATKSVKGKFQIAFYKEHALPEVTKADTLRFTDGAFDLRITY
jgi:hypothetical protein